MSPDFIPLSASDLALCLLRGVFTDFIVILSQCVSVEKVLQGQSQIFSRRKNCLGDATTLPSGICVHQGQEIGLVLSMPHGP